MTTPHQFEDSRDERLHAALRKLPQPKAPDSLVPNVMAAIRAREEAALRVSAWWTRPAATWHPAARAAFALVAIAALAGVVVALHLFVPQVSVALETGWPGRFAAKGAVLWNALNAIAGAILAVGRGLASPVLLGVLAGACFSYLALLGIGGALWRALLSPVRA